MKKQNNKIIISLNINKEILECVDELAERFGVNRSKFVQLILAEKLIQTNILGASFKEDHPEIFVYKK